MIHIFTARSQPATNYTDNSGGVGISGGWKPNQLLWVGCCHKHRPAKNVVVQCFYDGMNLWCAPDKGCKHPEVIAKKRRAEFRNRSNGQRARWASAAPEACADARTDVRKE